jgi:hypothetical protein
MFIFIFDVLKKGEVMFKGIKKVLFVSSMVAVAAISSQPAMADFKVRLGKANVHYEGNISAPTGNSNTAQDFQSNFFGATYIWDSGIYFDLSHYVGRVDRPGGFQDQRFDPTFTLGLAGETESGTKTSMFVGVKHGHTEYAGTPVGANTPTYSFDTNGFVMGGGLGFPMSNGTTVGVNAGIGFLRMLWGETYVGPTAPAASEDTSTMSLGYSYGVNYTIPFNQTFGLTLEYKGQSYNFKFGGTGTGPTHPSTVVEKVSTVGFNLYAQF